MKSIYVTGFMGAGKTTAGKALGKALDLVVYDSDQEIEKEQQQTITEIFAEQGEAAFREMERLMLQKLPCEDSVITTGGGIVINEENRQWMARHGYWVYLHCDPQEIERRLEHDETRPLLSGDRKRNLQNLFTERLPLYLQAAIVVDTTGKSMDDIVKEIRTRINETELEHTV
jgi:shikimate kinase